ncbi:MAG: DUF4422 domain-containing protein [Selenomonas sp.]
MEKRETRTNIFVAVHKPGWPDLPDGYTTIQVGAALHEHFSQVGAWDDAGENISEKNANFCELTALWWMTHHAQDDILGLAHYRRFFQFTPCRNPFIEYYHMKKDDSRFQAMTRVDGVPSMLETYDILLPYKRYFKEGIKGQYCSMHRSEDFAVLEDVFCRHHPHDREIFQRVMMGHEAYTYNMFVAKRDLVCAYADWLFDILFDVAERVVPSDDPYQARVFGFLSERLMPVFVETMHLRVKELPVIFIEDHPSFPWSRRSFHILLENLGVHLWR